MLHLILITTALVATSGFFGIAQYLTGYNHRRFGIPLAFILFGINTLLLLTTLRYIESFI